MKLLVITQKVDINDDLLGFFHGWLEGLAQKVDEVYVLALYVGEYHLPDNIKVFSLGKEKYLGYARFHRRLVYLWRLYKYIWQWRKKYDSVFVHMNTEYVNLAGWFWRLMRKKIILWYAHYRVDWRLKLAVFWSHRVVTSTAKACKLKSEKLRVIGQGTNINAFKKIQEKKDNKFHILYLGRISKIKKIDLLLKAFEILRSRVADIKLSLDIVGAPTPIDADYYQVIKKQAEAIDGEINFLGKVANYQTVEYYNQADLYINLTPTGSFDKTMLEAMACQTPALVSNKAFYEYFNEDLQKQMIFEEDSVEDLVRKIESFLRLSEEEQKNIGQAQREVIKKYHSLDSLVNNLINVFQEIR